MERTLGREYENLFAKTHMKSLYAFFFGGKIQKMLVLNSKEERTAPAWLFPEGGTSGPLSSFTGHVMTSSGPARWTPQSWAPQSQAPWDGRAGAPRALLAQPWAHQRYLYQLPLPSLNPRANYSNFSLFTENDSYWSSSDKHD